MIKIEMKLMMNGDFICHINLILLTAMSIDNRPTFNDIEPVSM